RVELRPEPERLLKRLPGQVLCECRVAAEVEQVAVDIVEMSFGRGCEVGSGFEPGRSRGVERHRLHILSTSQAVTRSHRCETLSLRAARSRYRLGRSGRLALRCLEELLPAGKLDLELVPRGPMSCEDVHVRPVLGELRLETRDAPFELRDPRLGA